MDIIIKAYDERGETIHLRSGNMQTLAVMLSHMIALKKDYPNTVGYKIDIRWSEEENARRTTRNWRQRLALSLQGWMD